MEFMLKKVNNSNTERTYQKISQILRELEQDEIKTVLYRVVNGQLGNLFKIIQFKHIKEPLNFKNYEKLIS